MPIVTATYERCSYQVKAVRVTSKNLEEIAEWCGGRVVNAKDYGWNVYSHGRKHVQVPTGLKGENIAHAHIGNWVTCLVKARSFRVYKEKSFLETFREVVVEADKFAKVHELLLKVARAQDAATYHGDSNGDDVALLIEKTAHEIAAMV